MRLRKTAIIALAGVLPLASQSSGGGQAAPSGEPPPAAHTMVKPEEVLWRITRPGLALALLEGASDKPGPYTMLLRLEDGAWIPPHWHNRTKRLIVVSGELLMGMGSTLDAQAATVIRAGGFSVVPAGSHHYEGAKGQTVFALLSEGPFQTTFVK